MAEHLPSTHQALGSVPSFAKRRIKLKLKNDWMNACLVRQTGEHLEDRKHTAANSLPSCPYSPLLFFFLLNRTVSQLAAQGPQRAVSWSCCCNGADSASLPALTSPLHAEAGRFVPPLPG